MILVLALLACGGPADNATTDGPPPSATTGPVDGDVLVVALQMDPGNISPLVAPYALSGMISELVEPGLVIRHVGADGLTYDPQMAERFDWSDGGKTLTYKLRGDLTWSDGVPFTSADVAFTTAMIADPAVASNWFGTAKHVLSVDTPDPTTVVYHFDQARNPVLQQGYTIRGIVPEHALKTEDRSSLRGAQSSRTPLASGPWQVAEWTPDEKVVLTANPHAPSDWKPHLDRIILKIVPEPATRLLELQNGDVDMVTDIDPETVPLITANPRLQLITEKAQAMQYIGYNLANPMFSDKRVRMALTEAINRDAIMKDLFTVDGVVHAQGCVGTIAPTLGPWFNADLKPVPFDVAGAKALLDEAGWKDSDGNGIRDAHGKELRFPMMVQTGDAKLQRIAVLTQAAWKDIGVALDIDNVEPTRFSERAHKKDYEAILWSFGANPKVDPSQEWRSDGPYNWFGFSDPAVDAKIDELVMSTDLDTAHAAAQEVQRLILEDHPVSFLFWEDSFYAVDKRFRDTDHNIFTALLHAEKWWVPAGEQKYKRN